MEHWQGVLGWGGAQRVGPGVRGAMLPALLSKPTLNSRRCFIAGAPALFRWPTSCFVILSSRHTL